MQSRLVAFLLIAGASTALAQGRRSYPEAVACKQQNASCREDCTIEFGTSIRTRDKLGRCLQKCESTNELCNERWTEIHSNNLDPAVMEAERRRSEPPAAPQERTRYDDDLREEDAAPRGARSERRAEPEGAPSTPQPERSPPSRAEEEPQGASDEPSVRSTRTRFVEPPSSRSSSPTASSEEPRTSGSTETSASSAGASSDDDAEDAPRPAPPPAAAEKRTARPGPTKPELPPEPKEDISEWDPNGD